jgi:hypothetical protein
MELCFMITRLYANNFGCLVAFETVFNSFGVLCGANGSGKSSVFYALKLLRDLGTGDAILGSDGEKKISNLEFTSWLKSTTQEFELGVFSDGHQFEYRLHLEQVSDDLKPRIVLESATCDGRELFTRNLDGVSFQKRDGTKTGFPLDWKIGFSSFWTASRMNPKKDQGSSITRKLLMQRKCSPSDAAKKQVIHHFQHRSSGHAETGGRWWNECKVKNRIVRHGTALVPFICSNGSAQSRWAAIFVHDLKQGAVRRGFA